MSAPVEIPRSRVRWLLVGRVGLLLAMLVLMLSAPVVIPSSAAAGTYDIFSCTQPDGAAAPVDGWSSFTDSADMLAEDNCAQAGYLSAGMLGWTAVAVGAESGWTFSPPAGTSIRQATLDWSYDNGDWQDTGSATAFESLEAPYRGSRPFATCVHSAPCCCTVYMGRIAPNNLVSVPTQDLQPEPDGPSAGISMVAGCTAGEPGDDHCEGDQSTLATFSGISTATITLEDDSPPQVAVVGGSLTVGSELEGTQTLAITGTDAGSGIYQAILDVDGKEAQSTTVDSNEGRCQNVGQTTDGNPGFLYVVPCKLEINDQYVSFKPLRDTGRAA